MNSCHAHSWRSSKYSKIACIFGLYTKLVDTSSYRIDVGPKSKQRCDACSGLRINVAIALSCGMSDISHHDMVMTVSIVRKVCCGPRSSGACGLLLCFRPIFFEPKKNWCQSLGGDFVPKSQGTKRWRTEIYGSSWSRRFALKCFTYHSSTYGGGLCPFRSSIWGLLIGDIQGSPAGIKRRQA